MGDPLAGLLRKSVAAVFSLGSLHVIIAPTLSFRLSGTVIFRVCENKFDNLETVCAWYLVIFIDAVSPLGGSSNAIAPMSTRPNILLLGDAAISGIGSSAPIVVCSPSSHEYSCNAGSLVNKSKNILVLLYAPSRNFLSTSWLVVNIGGAISLKLVSVWILSPSSLYSYSNSGSSFNILSTLKAPCPTCQSTCNPPSKICQVNSSMIPSFLSQPFQTVLPCQFRLRGTHWHQQIYPSPLSRQTDMRSRVSLNQ